jgi:fatty-acyl-CoA synthase
MWLTAAAVAGATIVGVNPTRRGPELARDIIHTDCQLLVTEQAHLSDITSLDLGIGPARILVVDDASYSDALCPHLGAVRPAPDVPASERFLLLFTSGTTGTPKAVICSQGRLASIASKVTEMHSLVPADVCYQAMPMFHGNALMMTWAPSLYSGAAMALRRRFSASSFLPDIRRYGATFFNYVGKPLSYILATPEQPDDGDNPLIRVFGNEASAVDAERFGRRFHCQVTESYGMSEGGASIGRTPETPQTALGPAPEGVAVCDPVTGEDCPRARFDGSGALLNADEAIGEIVNRLGVAGFEGYWRNDEANAARTRFGWYWTGDLGYRDEDGVIYFAGRDHDWLRVDGENFASAPIERVLVRFPDTMLAAVYAVADPDGSDQVMAALQLRPGATFDPTRFDAFLAEQKDMGTKWTPRFVRILEELPFTASNKVQKRDLRRQHWAGDAMTWWKPTRDRGYRLLTDEDRATLRRQFAERGRLQLLDSV